MQSASIDKRLEKLSHFSPTLVVIDECHRSVSNSYKKILSTLLTERCSLLGVTATPNRLDGTSLSDIYTFLLESSISREELIKQGYLLDVDYLSSPPVDYSTVKKNKNGEFLLTGLEDKIDTESNTEKIIGSFKKYGENKSTIVFAIGIVVIWLFNVKTLREVTSLEKELKIANENLEELEKELDKKIMFYDSKLDLDKIRRDMEAKGMKVSDGVIYFEIEE